MRWVCIVFVLSACAGCSHPLGDDGIGEPEIAKTAAATDAPPYPYYKSSRGVLR